MSEIETEQKGSGAVSYSVYRKVIAQGQTLLSAVFPAECISCRAPQDTHFALCPTCWSDVDFVPSHVCVTCAEPIWGDGHPSELLCETCWSERPSWHRGHALYYYNGVGRSLVLRLKHADRMDIARAMGRRMGRKLAHVKPHHPILVPVPLHWRRYLKRRYNQSLELAKWISHYEGLDFSPDALCRVKHTHSLDDYDADTRRKILTGAILVPKRRQSRIAGRNVVLIDDVLTTGATLAACTTALHEAGAARVDIMVLARARKEY